MHPTLEGQRFLTDSGEHIGSGVGCFSITMIVWTLVTGSGLTDNYYRVTAPWKADLRSGCTPVYGRLLTPRNVCKTRDSYLMT